MPKVTDEHTESRREQIMFAAITCFAKKGYHKTSMRDICQQAALSAGAVYHYFSSKDEIIAAVAQSGQEMNQQMFESAKVGSESISCRVEKNIDNYRDFMKQTVARDCVRADIMFNAEALTNDELRKLGTESYNLIIEHLVDLVKEWQASGEINSDLPASAIAKVMFSTVQGLQLQTVIEPDMDIDEYFKVVKSLLLGKFNVNQ